MKKAAAWAIVVLLGLGVSVGMSVLAYVSNGWAGALAYAGTLIGAPAVAFAFVWGLVTLMKKEEKT